jgi:predicted nucleic acid-binding protein
VIVVADTSVLLNLCRIGQVELLARLFHEVVIPPEVAVEFGRLAK